MTTLVLNQTQVRNIVLESRLTLPSPYRIDAKSAGVLYKGLVDGEVKLDQHAEPFRECLQTELRELSKSKITMDSEAQLTAYVRCEDCGSKLYRTVHGPQVKGTLYECVCDTRWRPVSLLAKATK